MPPVTAKIGLPTDGPVCDCACCRFADALEPTAVVIFTAMGINAAEAAGGLAKLMCRLLMVYTFEQKHGKLEELTEAEICAGFTPDVADNAAILCEMLHERSMAKLKRASEEFAARAAQLPNMVTTAKEIM